MVSCRRNPGWGKLKSTMDIDELRKRSNVKVLLRGKSGYGKTRNAVLTALEILAAGGSVLYADAEGEAADTILQKVDDGDYDEDVVEGLTYKDLDEYQDLATVLNKGSEYDLVVIDPIDHKHGFVLKEVTDAKLKAEADWNQYPVIYSKEGELMRDISKMDTNVICTLDPESGKSDKPKGAQVNIQGYYSVVVDLFKDGDEWTHKVENWVARSDLIGGAITNIQLYEALSKSILKRGDVE